MTPLRQRMLEDMQLRGLAPKTQDAYLRAVRQLAEHIGKPPGQVSEAELRDYYLYLKNEKKASRSACTVALCGLKFFFEQTLGREWQTFDLVRPPREKKLPVILSRDEVRQVLGEVRRYRYRRRFFLPVKALSILFRAKFRDALKQSISFDQIPASLWMKDWVVHCQPVGRGKRALTYLAAYIFRVALSNYRLVGCAGEAVTFRYRPSGSQQWRLCRLTPLEFMRRFLQHVLPKGFVKVRYYGFFSPGQRPTLAQIRDFLTPTRTPASSEKSTQKQVHCFSCPVWLCCPHCGQPLHRRRMMPALSRIWQPP